MRLPELYPTPRPCRAETTNEISQCRFRNADQLVTVNRTRMLETYLHPNGYLCRQAIVSGVDGGACDRRKLRINQNLAAYYSENTGSAGIIAIPPIDAIKLRS